MQTLVNRIKTQEICLSWCSKVFAVFLISRFVHICHINIFHIIKHILMSDKDNLSKYNMQFLNDDFFYQRKQKLFNIISYTLAWSLPDLLKQEIS